MSVKWLREQGGVGREGGMPDLRVSGKKATRRADGFCRKPGFAREKATGKEPESYRMKLPRTYDINTSYFPSTRPAPSS